MKFRCLPAVLCAALMLTACGSNAELTKHVKPQEIPMLDGTEAFCNAQMQFSLSLFAEAAANTDENMLISPYLAMSAWLTAADGDPENNAAEPFGSFTRTELNSYFVKWRSTQAGLHDVQSFWIDPAQRGSMQKENLRYLLGLSGTQVFAAARTQDAVSQWLKDASGGSLTEIAVQENAESAMLSAASYDLEWSKPYSDNEVQNVRFRNADGSDKSVPFLCRTYDDAVYLDDDSIRGLRRNCAGQKYALLMLMPKSGSVTELIEALTPEQLTGYIRGGSDQTLRTGIPLMDAEYTMDLAEYLPETGAAQIVQAVSVGIGRGTEEAVFSMQLDSSAAKPAEQMLFDHPFVYFVIDRQYGLPVFAGTVKQLT